MITEGRQFIIEAGSAITNFLENLEINNNVNCYKWSYAKGWCDHENDEQIWDTSYFNIKGFCYGGSQTP